MLRTERWISGCACVVLMSCISAQAAGKTDDPVSVIEKSFSRIQRTVLNNGMRCLVKEDHSAPVVSVQIWIGTGSIHEDENLGGGLSHYVEHMIFKGTAKRKGGDITRDIDNAGGSINAYTSLDRTVIHADLPADSWKVGVDVLSDAVMNSVFPEDEWAREKEVILRELAMNRDAPDRVVDKLLWSTAFTEHPYKFPVIGLEDTFKQMNRAELVGYFQRRYQPDNMVTVVVGDVSGAEVEAELRRVFAEFKRKPARPVLLQEEPRQLGARYLRRTGPYNVSRVEMAFHTIALTHKDLPALDTLAAVVGQGASSRLVRELRDKRQLVLEIGASSYTPAYPGLFGISIVCEPGKEQAAIDAVRTEIRAWQKGSFTREEVAKAVRMATSSEVSGLQTMGGQANSIASGELSSHDPKFAIGYLSGLSGVQPADLSLMARKYMVPENETVVILAPEGKGSGPAVAETVKGLPAVKKLTLSNGVVLLFREDHRIPFVYVFAGSRGGLLAETDSNAGVTMMMADLLTRGAGKLNADDISARTESAGASLGPISGKNSFGLSGRCFSSDVDKFMDLFSDCLLRPSFPAKEVELQRGLQLASIERQREQPMFLAQQSLASMIHAGHPYRRSEVGTTESVKALTREQLVSYHSSYVVAGNMGIAVFGDISEDKAVKLAEKCLSGLKAGKMPVRTAQQSTPVLPARAEVRAPREQTIVLFGFPGVKLGDPRAEALNVLDGATSGLSSDVAEEVREKRGLAYYVGSINRIGLDPGMFVFYAGIKKEALPEVERIFNEEIQRLVTKGLRQEEFDRARKQIIAGYEMSLQDNLSVAMSCVLNELYGLGYDYAFSTKERLGKLTPDDVRSAAASILDPKRMAVTILVPEEKKEKKQ
ncbi:MAG: pitrilysin family protein [bacterium]